MKTIIFSDTHLTKRFSKRKFEFLKTLILRADKIIINGDFWDAYFISFDKFVKSKWNELFPFLKAKNTIYLNGNHDQKKWCDKRVDMFSSIQAQDYELRVGKYKLKIQHGNVIRPSIGEKYPWTSNWITCNLGLGGRNIFTRIFGENFVKIFPPARKTQKKLINWSLENMYGNEIFVASHSHTPILDLTKRYINTGFIGQTYASYIEINDKKIDLIKKRY